MADKGILELTSELIRFCLEGGAVNESDLAYVTNVLNSRIRSRGLSAWEICFQRDSDSLEQLDFSDGDLANAQVTKRLDDQGAAHKTGSRNTAKAADIHPGSLVFIKEDGDKTRGRERYLVVKVDGNMCTLMKLNKSKLQKKEYQLKVTEVFPVIPTIEVLDSCSKGFDYSDDDDCEISHNESLSHVPPVPQVVDPNPDVAEYGFDSVRSDLSASVPHVCTDPESSLVDTDVQDDIESTSDSDDGECQQVPHVESQKVPPLNIHERPKRGKRDPIWMGDYVPR